MDASTSTIFLKLVGHTKILGDFIVYTAGNFRDGSNKGFQLRNAYVSFRDVTVGYTYGGFMDLGALLPLSTSRVPTEPPFTVPPKWHIPTRG